MEENNNLTRLLSLSRNEIIYNVDNLKRYKEIYASFFGREPNCASCNFNSDFQALKNIVNNRKFEKKEDMKKYVLKKGYENKIFTYRDEQGVFRRYGKDLTDDFVDSYLLHGMGKVEDRNAIFLVLEKDEDVIKVPKKSKKNK